MVIRKLAYLMMTLLLTVGMAGPATAAEESESAAAELSDLLAGYKSFEASFIQIVVNGNNQRVQETRGELKAKRPGLFYWETSTPLPQFIVSDGKTVEVYDPDLEQVTVHNLDERVATTPALLLSGEVGNLKDNYEVSGKALAGDTREYTLTPLDEDSLFVSLKLKFSDGTLQEMRMRDSLSQLSVLSFHNIQVNGNVSDSVFRLDYPDTVDVIRDGA